MWFGDRPRSAFGASLMAAALGVLLSGCAGFPFFGPATPAAETPPPLVVASPVASSVPAPPAEAPPPAAVVEAPAPPPAPVEPPLPTVDAATQASFDEAVRMLRGNRLPEAERAFKALAERQPLLAGVHANLGLIQRRAGRLEESAVALQRAVELSPKQAAYHNQLGITWRALGRFDHARKAYETAIELDATHAGALVNLAILNDLYLGEPARAAELYTRGAALLPSEAATINKWLAELKNRRADPKLAASAPNAGSAGSAGAAGSPAAPPTTPRKEKE